MNFLSKEKVDELVEKLRQPINTEKILKNIWNMTFEDTPKYKWKKRTKEQLFTHKMKKKHDKLIWN